MEHARAMLGKNWGDGLAGIWGGVLLSFWDNLGQTEDGQYVSGRVMPMHGLPRVWIVAMFGSMTLIRYRSTLPKKLQVPSILEFDISASSNVTRFSGSHV